MKNTNCLGDQDLTLHYYGEIPPSAPELQHFNDCRSCQERFAALRQDLDALPNLSQVADPAAGTRMAARVSERLARRRIVWLPVVGGAAVAAVALVVTLSIWPSQPDLQPQPQPVQTAANNTVSLEESMPDIDFLNDIELLKELELLRQIEGV